MPATPNRKTMGNGEDLVNYDPTGFDGPPPPPGLDGHPSMQPFVHEMGSLEAEKAAGAQADAATAAQPLHIGLSEIQLLAIEHCIRGWNDRQIAKELDISVKTLWRWKTFNEDYRLALTNARAQAFAFTVDCYQNVARKATGILMQYMDGNDDRDRFRAAQLVLRMNPSFRHKPLPQHPPILSEEQAREIIKKYTDKHVHPDRT